MSVIQHQRDFIFFYLLIKKSVIFYGHFEGLFGICGFKG